jgi:hypothetical protein
MTSGLEALWEGFCSPPDEARPRAWWHWMDGNVDLDGIRQDLEWLHAVGVRGVQMFEGGMGTPLVVAEPVEHGSPAWHSAVRFATETARRLGLEFAVATSPGWSAAGGPWVGPGDAMKKVVWSSTVVDGGSRVARQLPPVPDVRVRIRTVHGGERTRGGTGMRGTGLFSPSPPNRGRGREAVVCVHR